MRKLGIAVCSFCLAAFAVACGGGEDGQDGDPGQDGDSVTIVDLDEGHDVCEYGGQKILVGTELTEAGEVDEEAASTTIHYVCDGSEGEPGEPGEPGEDGDSLFVQKTEFDADDEDYDCEDGGVHFIFGTEITGGVIPSDAIVEEATICDGTAQDVTATVGELDDAEDCPGTEGQKVTFEADGQEIAAFDVCDGADGDDGCTALISVGEGEANAEGLTCRTVETTYVDPAGEVCDDSMYETDDYTVCDGADGMSVLVEDQAILPGAEDCSGNGGVSYTFGYDTTDDGDIDDVLSEATICHGSGGEGNGGSGNVSTEVEEVEEHPECDDGPATEITFFSGSIQISDTIVVCDGVDGEAGEAGDDGCTPLISVDSADVGTCPAGGHTTTIEYDGPDCSELAAPAPSTVCNGEDGEDGEAGCGDILTWEHIDETDMDGMAECPYGGKEVTVTMRDYNTEDDVCEIGDVRDTFYVCDGADVTDACQLVPFGYCEGEDFTDPQGEFADLDGDLSNLSLRYIDLRNANLEGVDMTNSDLTGAKLNGATFENGFVVNAQFQGADFSGANLGGTGTFTDASLSGATFDSETICPDRNPASLVNGEYTCTGDQLDACILLPGGSCSGFSLCGQTISEDLTDVDLSETELRGANLTGSILSDADLTQTQFGPGMCDDGNPYGPANLTGVPLDGADATEADFVEVELDNTTFEDAWLIGTDLSDASINGSVSFEGADATGASFAGAELDGADFSNVPLSEASFAAATLTGGASFEGAWATDAEFMNATLDGSDFSDATLNEADFTDASIDGGVSFADVFAEDAIFSGAGLDSADFRGASLDRADLSGVIAPGAWFDDVDAVEAQFNGANLDGSSFENVWVEWADFSDASINGDVSFENANIRNADFSNTGLDGANFDTVTVREMASGNLNLPELTDTTFANADFASGASFWDAELRSVDFSAAESTGVVDFTDGDLVEANFTGATLPGVDFTNARLTGSTFVNATMVGLIGNGAMFFGVDFENATITDAFFDPIVEGTGSATDYEFTDLRQARFNGANLTGSTLAYADLNNATFVSTTLVDADLRGATSFPDSSANWGNTHCPDFSLSDEHGSGTCNALTNRTACRLLPMGTCSSDYLDGLNSTDLLFGLRDRYVPEIDLSDASLQNANLEMSVLNDATFDDADLRDADFTDAELMDAQFDSVRLARANFTNAVMIGATINDAVNANETVFTNAEVGEAELTNSSFLNVNFDFLAVDTDFSGSTLVNVDFRDVIDFDDAPANRLNAMIFDDVTFTGNVWLGPQHFNAVSMLDVVFEPSFFVDFGTSEFTDDSDLEGMCGIDQDDVDNVTFEDGTICPNGTVASGGTGCAAHMLPSCN